MSEQPVDSSIKRIEYKIEKITSTTKRQKVEKEVEIENIKQLISKIDKKNT